MTPDPKVAVVGRAQSEFAQPISAYLDGAVSGGRIRRGGELARQWAATLDAVEAFYGVPRSVVLAAWGMESNFGGYTGRTPSSGRSRPSRFTASAPATSSAS